MLPVALLLNKTLLNKILVAVIQVAAVVVLTSGPAKGKKAR